MSATTSLLKPLFTTWWSGSWPPGLPWLPRGLSWQRLHEAMPAWMDDRIVFGIAWWQVLATALAILLGLVVRTVVAWAVARWGQHLIRLRGERASSSLVALAAKPIGTLAMAGVLWWALPLLDYGERAERIFQIALRVMAAAAGVVLCYRMVDVLSDIFERRAAKTETKLDDQLVPLIRKTLKVFVVAMGVIFVLQNMNVDVGSLLAGASLGGLAFTLAAKDTVANLFGSVNILADRPFQVGDWIVVSGYEGIVEEVGMRSTRIRTFYNSLVSIPNSVVANAAVDNYGARRYRRTYIKLGVRYDTTPEQIQAFCEGIRAIIQANPHTRKDYYEVHFSGFGPHALEIMVYFFFEVPTWSDELRERHNVFLEILRLAERLGVQFAFPTQTLHVETLAEPRPVPERPIPPPEQLKQAVEAFGPGGKWARPEGPRLTHGYFAVVKRSGSEGTN